MLSPLKQTIFDSEHEAFIVLQEIWFVSNNKNLYVDVWLLTENLSQGEIAKLRSTENPRGPHYCCYKPGGPDNEGALEDLINGFARIIVYSY